MKCQFGTNFIPEARFSCQNIDIDVYWGGQELYLPGLKWILEHSGNVTHLAMAPFLSNLEMFFEADEENEVLGSLTVLQKQMQSRIYRYFNKDWMTHRMRFFEVSYPKITTLAISTPQTIQNRSGLIPFLEGSGGEQGYPIGKFIIPAMQKLKHLTLPTGGGATYLMKGLCNVEGWRKIKLESLTALAFQRRHYLDPGILIGFSLVTFSPLRVLYLSISSKICTNKYNFITGIGIVHLLNWIKLFVEKIELEVDCELEEEDSGSMQKFISENADQLENGLRRCTFPKLTHFKVTLDYDTFPGSLGTTDLNYLKRMPKIQEYYFGMKKVEKDWVTRKLEFVDDGVEMLGELTDLKSFHFHGNFTKESLRRLGGIMGHLNTLEVVLDEENFQIVGEMWPRLKKLKMLEGSGVSDEFLSNLKLLNPSLEYE